MLMNSGSNCLPSAGAGFDEMPFDLDSKIAFAISFDPAWKPMSDDIRRNSLKLALVPW